MRKQLTKTIAGVPLTLDRGIRYRASRPFSSRGRSVYPVTIERLDDPVRDVMTIDRLTYEAADALVNAFNNGPTSFDGRVW